MKSKDLKYNRGLTLFKKSVSSKSVYIKKYVCRIERRAGRSKKNTYNLFFKDGEVIIRVTYAQSNSCVC